MHDHSIDGVTVLWLAYKNAFKSDSKIFLNCRQADVMKVAYNHQLYIMSELTQAIEIDIINTDDHSPRF
jgi:hypothetical protein